MRIREKHLNAHVVDSSDFCYEVSAILILKNGVFETLT
jgi:hypothetical protein